MKSNNSKIFRLINNEQISLEGSKILSSEEYSMTLSAIELIETAKKDAEQLLIKTNQEAQDIKEKAQKEGFEEGLKKWAEQIKYLEEEISNVRGELQKSIFPVALTAAKKIVGREIETNPDTVADIIANSLKSVHQHKKIVIYANRKDIDILEKNKPQLRSIFEHLESLSIRERSDIEPGGSIIETEAGIINAQLSNQWEILERAFENISKGKRGN
ncbi:Yop proteins translocation protein L [Candidatus Rubidus massiliensis]|nr:Yop proteins translocation protein L [Candidatus Rubidus massiliensis]